MSTIDFDGLKPVANRLAEELATSDNPVELLALMHQLGFISSREKTFDQQNAAPKQADEKDQVGIWVAEQRDGQKWYVRDPEIDPVESGFWADHAEFPAKSTQRRVVLIGESVATGFFFAPQYTLAKALQQILRAEDDQIEVIDLTRPDLSFEIIELVRQSQRLNPDAILFFAGNNWQTALDDESLFQQSLADYAVSKRVSAIKTNYEQHMVDSVSALFEQLRVIQSDSKIPIIPVLPEFNLAGFTHDVIQFPPMLADASAGAEWLQARNAAQASLAESNFAQAIPHAERMIELDENTLSAGQQILAECYIGLAQAESARQALQQARDNEIWLLASATPRCYGVVQDTVRAKCDEYQWRYVDLPAELARYSENGIPGEALFLDYCHLNVKGLELTAAAMANAALAQLADKTYSMDELSAHFEPPSDAAVARAYFMAAVHNASWGQNQQSLIHHLEQALAHDANIADMAVLWAKVVGQRRLAVFAQAYTDVVRQDDAIYHELLYRLATLQPLMYKNFADSLIQIFGENHPELVEAIQVTRQLEHTVSDQTLDLLEPYYSVPSVAHAEFSWNMDYAYYRAFSPSSQMVFYADQAHAITLQLCLRQPTLGPDGVTTVVVKLNDMAEYRVALQGHKWQEVNWQAPAEAVRAGANQITIVWPDAVNPESYRGKGIQRLRRSHYQSGGSDVLKKRKRMANFFPIYGELAALNVSG